MDIIRFLVFPLYSYENFMSNTQNEIIGNKNNVKKQHVVPNFLLKNFSQNGGFFQFNIKKYEKDDKNFYTSKTTDRARGTPEKKFYDIMNQNGEEISAEDILGKIENNFSLILPRIIKDKSLFKIKNSDLQEFICMMFVRSPLGKYSSNNDSIGLDQYNRISNIENCIKEYERGEFYLKEYENDLIISDTPLIVNRKGGKIATAKWFLPISSNLLLISCPLHSTFDINTFNLTTSELNISQMVQAKEFIYSKKDYESLMIDLYKNSKEERKFLEIMNRSIDSQKNTKDKDFMTNIWDFIISNRMSKNSIINYLQFIIKNIPDKNEKQLPIDELLKIKSLFKE